MDKVKSELKEIMDEKDIDELKFYKWTWCEHCKNTWYSWRLWIHEVLILSEDMEKNILNLDSASVIEKVAKKNWMITIVQDALLKAAMWNTTIEEALKLI
jgi:type II secretory ATPase GspE/PulE/Tfp pilus assembly ATPase PilB-like protein